MLIRGIASVSRWDGSTRVTRDDATTAGDVISDLRTTQNTLSVWNAETNDAVDDAVVAIALGRTSISKVVALQLDEAELNRMEIYLKDEPGKANGAIDAIKNNHRNMLEIDYKRLGLLSNYMLDLCRKGEFRIQKSESEVAHLIKRYIDEDKIKADEMGEDLQNSFARWIKRYMENDKVKEEPISGKIKDFLKKVEDKQNQK